MKAEQLLAHYERVAVDLEAGPRLRRFVVDLAVRGKLVPQYPSDEPASELLSRISTERAQLAKTGGIRRQRSVKPSQPNGLSFGLPSGWAMAMFADVVTELQTGPFGSSLHQNDYEVGGTPVINPASMLDGRIVPVEQMAVPEGTLERLARFKLEVGDIVMARRGEMGRCAVVTERENGWLCGTGSLIVRLPQCINPWYLAMLLGSTLVREYLGGAAVGATMQNLNQSILLKMWIGLPPLAEQSRIVTMVDDMMALCDRLEASISEQETARDRFLAATFARLSDPDPDTFQLIGTFAIKNFTDLTTRPDQIDAVRQAIIDLAVRGKLVRHTPNDEPASELVRRIAEKKRCLVEAGEIRNPKPIPSLSPDEIPFALPPNWTWSQVAKIGVLSPRNNAPDETQVSFVSMSMIAAEYGASHRHEIRRWVDVKSGYTHFAEGDVGLAKITPCFENGKSTVFQNLIGGIGCGTTELHVVRPLFVDPRYVVLFFKSSHFIETGIPKMTGTAGQKRVPAEYFANSPFPLPPLAEQRRIVTKVDGLMGLCDRLETSLATAEDRRRRVLEALLRDALEPTREVATLPALPDGSRTIA